MQNSDPFLLCQHSHWDPIRLKLLHNFSSHLVLIFHMLLPMILPSKSPDNAVIQTWFDRVPTPIVGTEVLDLVVMNAVVVPFEIFWRGKAAGTLFAANWSGVIHLVTTLLVSATHGQH
jgi:hypothetical protein